MDYDAIFAAQLDKLKEEGNYRIFAELERQSGCLLYTSPSPRDPM